MTRALIIVGDFYTHIAEMLHHGACVALEEQGWQHQTIRVPGAFEIPAVIRRRMSSEFSAYIALGCVIRGETSHYDYICQESARGLMTLVCTHGLAIGYGILTVENEQQAIARAALDQGNKGKDAVAAALAVAAVPPH